MATKRFARALPVAGIGLLFVFLCVVSSIGIFEDAFIGFRYSENLAHGHGLVFNPGEHVWGYSNFLWTVLLALCAKIGFSITASAKFCGVLASLVVLAVSYRWCKSYNRQPVFIAVSAPLLLATSDHFLLATQNGMETALFTLWFLTGALSFIATLENQRLFPSYAIWFLLASITRPEGPLLMVVAVAIEVVVLVIVRQASVLRRLGLGILIFGGGYGTYTAIMYLYYGYPLPNPFYVKVDLHATGQVNAGWQYVKAFFSDIRAYLLLLPTVAIVADPKKLIQNGILLVFVAAYLTFVVRVGGDFLVYFYRFMIPVLPLLFLLTANGLSSLSLMLPMVLPEKWVSVPMTAILMLMLVGNFLLVRSPIIPFFSPIAEQTPVVTENLIALFGKPSLVWPMLSSWSSDTSLDIHPMGMVGQALDKMLPHGRTVAIDQAGEIPYYLRGRRIVDLLGLMNNYLAHSKGELTPEYLKKEGIDYFVLYYNETHHYYIPLTLLPNMISSEYFRKNYYLDHVFCHTSRFQKRNLESRAYMLLFARRTPPLAAVGPFRNLKKEIHDTIAEGRATEMMCNLNWPDRGQFILSGRCPCRHEAMITYFSPEETWSAQKVQPQTLRLPTQLTGDQPVVSFLVDPAPGFVYEGWANVTLNSISEARKARLTLDIVSSDGSVRTTSKQESSISGWGAFHAGLAVNKLADGDQLRVSVTSDGPMDGALKVENLMVFRSRDAQTSTQ